MRLMFLGDMIWGESGYAKVVQNTCFQLLKEKHEIAHIPMAGAMRGGKFNFHGVLVYPGGNHPFGEDVTVKHYLDFKADMLITVKEPWVFQEIHHWGINFVPLAVIDHAPISPLMISVLKNAFKIIAISRFGQRELKKANLESVYIPHGVSCETYVPLDQDMRKLCRKLWYLEPDHFVVGIVAMNRTRKMIPRMLRGYKRFLEMNPGIKSSLMLWTDVTPIELDGEVRVPGVSDSGVNLLPEIFELGLGEVVHWPEPKLIAEGIPEWTGPNFTNGWDMTKLYNSFDVLMLCSGGEGFGMPLLEAQSCGVPVITTDYAAGPELVGAGLTVKYDDYVILNTPGTRYALASVDGMGEALTKIYNADRGKLARKARLFAERYSWDKITEQYWRPFLESCELDLRPRLVNGEITRWDF